MGRPWAGPESGGGRHRSVQSRATESCVDAPARLSVMTAESASPEPSESKPALRIGVLVPAGDLPAPAAQILEEMRSCDFAKLSIALVVTGKAAGQTEPGSLIY